MKYATPFIKNKPYVGAQMYIDYTIAYLGLQPVKNVKPLRPDNNGLMVVNDVTAFNYPIDIPKCSSRKEEESTTAANRTRTTLFIAILSAPNYFEKRQIIRETWLRHIKDAHYTRDLLDVVGYAFVVGQTSSSDQSVQLKIEQESRNHSDILQVQMDDSYHNLTRKSVAILNWVNNNCARAHFVMKIDNDLYVNVHNLATLLDELSSKETSIYGRYEDPGNISRPPSNCKMCSIN